MGTQQALTTEQLELLILIDDICDCIEEKQFEEEFNTPMPVTAYNIMCEENEEIPDDKEQYRIEKICDILKYYEYLDDNYFITIDGKQYLELFKEYIESKMDNPSIVNTNFISINYVQLEANLETSLLKVGVAENIGEYAKLGNSLLQLLKKFLRK